MILVELAGAAGVGKSTVAPLLARKLRDTLGERRVAALPEKDQPRRRRRWRKIHRWTWMATHPQLVLAAWRISHTGPASGSFRKWLHAFSTIGIGRESLGDKVQVVLVDQGLLRLTMGPGHAALVPKPLLPDLVLQLTADPAELELRRIYRSKTKHSRVQGEVRLTHARATRQCLQKLPEAALRDALVQFGRKFCEPALTDDEVDAILQEPAQPQAAGTSAGTMRCDPAVCEVLRQRGVRWELLDNSQSGALDALVAKCVDAILAADAAVNPPARQ